jgi:hypothetical protein
VSDLLLDAVLIGCIGLVAVGAGLIYLPAGLIVAGLLGFWATLNYVKGAARDRQADRPGP